MKAADPLEVAAQIAKAEGFMRAAALLAIRFRMPGEAADLMNTRLDDTPDFLKSPILPLEVHTTIREMRETLVDMFERQSGRKVK